MAAEFDFIEWIKAQQRPTAGVITPVGDDLAVLRWEGDDLLLVGVDQVLDGVHFDSSVHSPRAIGRKAMNRNLSDCAAMACLPAAAVATFALPSGVGLDYAKELFEGMKEAGDVFDCPIVGGDTGSWEGKLVVTVTIVGRSGGIQPVTRSGARGGDKLYVWESINMPLRGDKVYVTGPLGGSLLGRHMTFTPRIALARRLASEYRVTSMIDLSDGLSRDLRHIADQSKVSIVLDALKIPIHPDAIEMRRDGRPALDHALHDGEDYELLFTSPDEIPGELATQIGVCVRSNLPTFVMLWDQGKATPLLPKGWEHKL